MAKKVIINPRYGNLKEYIEAIPENFDSLGLLLDARRNILRQDTVSGVTLVIKSFKRIYLPNRIRYSFFVASKAQRSFDYGNILLEKGFNTPVPIAYVEIKKWGMITESFFVSEHLDFQPLELISRGNSDSDSVSEWIPEFAQYTCRLHQNGVCHVDYNLGNVLFKKMDNHYEFALVDNNRIKFGPVSLRKGMMNMMRLGLSLVDNVIMAREYARMWNIDEEKAVERLFHYKLIWSRNDNVKVALKRMVKR